MKYMGEPKKTRSKRLGFKARTKNWIETCKENRRSMQSDYHSKTYEDQKRKFWSREENR